jgi:hypothetical protein
MTRSITPARAHRLDAELAAPTTEEAAEAIAELIAASPLKSWRKSLTYQGIAVMFVAPWVVSHSVGIFAALHAGDPAGWAKGLGEALTDVGGFLAIVGRARLGGLR